MIRNTMSYTLGEAAKATGKSKPTISRAIKKGTISGEKNANGEYVLDPSEVHRVWPKLQPTSNDAGTVKQSETHSSARALQTEIDMLRERLADKDATIEDLRTRLDQEGEERRQLTAVLTDLRKPKGFWARLKGK